MSGNSTWSRLQTAPIVCWRPGALSLRRSVAVLTSPRASQDESWHAVLEEGHRQVHFEKKVSRYLPICSSSPSSSSADSTRRRLTYVPFRLPWSSIVNRPSWSTRTAWFLETVTSSRKTSQSGERPIVVLAPCGTTCSPALPP